MQVRDCAFLSDLAANDSLGDLSADRVRPLYRGLADACFAAFEGKDQFWTSAANELTTAESTLATGGLDCRHSAAFGLLRRVVAAHEESASGRVRVVAAAGTACPWSVTRVAAGDSSGTPASGPLSGGTSVEVSGVNMMGVTAVCFGDTPGVDVQASFDSVFVTSPPADNPGRVRITVESPGGRRTSPAGQVFEYVAGGSG